MDERVVQLILQRLGKLEREAARLRIGEVTDVNPLDVALGGSNVSYEDVQAIGPLADNDQVAALVSGNDLLVLGALNRGVRFGAGTVTFSGAQNSANTVVTHGLGRTPVAVVMTAACLLGWNVMRAFSLNATTFTAAGHDVDAARTGSDTFYWVAVG